MMKKLILTILCVVILLLGSCLAILLRLLFPPVPRAFLQVPPGTSVERVFDCAEQQLEQLKRNGANYGFWEDEITTRDISNGILETGDFADNDRMGVRIRLDYKSRYGGIQLQLKGIGPYYTDLEAEDAIHNFEQRFRVCLLSIH